MIKNPWWLVYCLWAAYCAILAGMRCIDAGGDVGGGVTYALLSLMDCLCFGYGYAKARGLSLWPS